MTNTSIAQTQPTTRFMWRLGLASGAVSTGAAILLIPLAERTADFFAWTIAVPASAAFIGLFYLALTVMALLSLRQQWWAPVRAALVPAVVFVALVLVTTLIHLDKFHLFSGGAAARIPTIGLLVFGIGALAVAARYGDQVQWTRPSAWAYLAVTLALAVVALTMLPRSGSVHSSAVPTR
jgi:hypothetical protein